MHSCLNENAAKGCIRFFNQHQCLRVNVDIVNAVSNLRSLFNDNTCKSEGKTTTTKKQKKQKQNKNKKKKKKQKKKNNTTNCDILEY